MMCLQVTESIPKSIFDKANRLRKTCYLKATQVPRVGGKQVHTAAYTYMLFCAVQNRAKDLTL